MTLDELNTLFDFAVSRSIQTNREDLPPWAHRGAGIRAVVEALKREVVSVIKDGESWPWTSVDADDWFDEILASDGVKSEGYTGGMNDLNVTPAAAPVCEWTLANDGCWQTSCGWGREAIEPYPVKCPVCVKPIKFKEAAR